MSAWFDNASPPFFFISAAFSRPPRGGRTRIVNIRTYTWYVGGWSWFSRCMASSYSAFHRQQCRQRRKTPRRSQRGVEMKSRGSRRWWGCQKCARTDASWSLFRQKQGVGSRDLHPQRPTLSTMLAFQTGPRGRRLTTPKITQVRLQPEYCFCRVSLVKLQ